jgi:NADH-quinone oxidoreductase subunit J
VTGVLAAAPGAVPTAEAVVFWILAPIALGGALAMVFARNAIHSALFLVLTMGCLGVFYFVEQGPFIGVVQIIVYTGAIMILFLFVIMLVGRESSDSLVETLRGQRVAATLLGLGFAGLAGTAIGRSLEHTTPAGLASANANGQNVNAIAEKLFTNYLFAFELTSALLIVAAVGAMVLAHVERDPGSRRTQRELARERFRGPRPQPLPGPGVFATGDSIATPALLPDGSVAPDSLSRLVEPQLPDEPGLLPALPDGGQVDADDEVKARVARAEAGTAAKSQANAAARAQASAGSDAAVRAEADATSGSDR